VSEVLRRLAGGLLVLLIAGLSTGAAAQAWPARPVRIIVPNSAGGITDVNARRLAEKLSAALGQQVVVENKPGASGTIGASAAAKAKPDGYTVFFGSTSSLALSPALGVPTDYDPLKSFDPVILFGSTPMLVIAHPSLGVATVGELVTLSRRRPGALNYGTGGSTSTNHFVGEVFRRVAGVDMTHVPYKSITHALMAVVGNEVPLGVDYPDTSAEFVRTGKLKALVVTGARRVEILPGVPHALEAGIPQLDLLGWVAIVVPAGTPREIVERLNAEIGKALRASDLREAMNRAGWEVGGGTPAELGGLMRAEQGRWAKLVQMTGIARE
jgi:tripartite-type tricarboxylate transporter receptor subunit TctC